MSAMVLASVCLANLTLMVGVLMSGYKSVVEMQPMETEGAIMLAGLFLGVLIAGLLGLGMFFS